MDLCFLDVFDYWNYAGFNMGILWAWLGRLLVLGPSRKRIPNAMVLFNCFVAHNNSLRKKLILKSWTLILSIATFTFSMSGTFLVRSGILNSIHTFANDPSRGIFILVFLFSLIFLSIIIFFLYFYFFNHLEIFLIKNLLLKK